MQLATMRDKCTPTLHRYKGMNGETAKRAIEADLSWTRIRAAFKLQYLWDRCATLSSTYGIVIDPRVLLANLKIEGTASFNSNKDVSAALTITALYDETPPPTTLGLRR